MTKYLQFRHLYRVSRLNRAVTHIDTKGSFDDIKVLFMTRYKHQQIPYRFSFIFALTWGILGCVNEINVLDKADFDISILDQQGLLQGVALNFEFCIANKEHLLAEISQLYPDLTMMPSSPGRIGCAVQSDGKGKQVLVVGSTYVKGYRAHFEALLSHPSIHKVQRTYWE